MNLGLKISGVTVFDMSKHETWSSAMFNQRLLKTYGDDLINDIEIHELNQTTEITNEFLSAVVQRDTPESGYEKFLLWNFRGLKTPLEESVFNRVIEKLSTVKEFKIAHM